LNRSLILKTTVVICCYLEMLPWRSRRIRSVRIQTWTMLNSRKYRRQFAVVSCLVFIIGKSPEDNHVLHRLLPQRERTRNLTLPTDGNAVNKQNFVHRSLFSVGMLTRLKSLESRSFVLIPGKEFLHFRESRLATARQ